MFSYIRFEELTFDEKHIEVIKEDENYAKKLDGHTK